MTSDPYAATSFDDQEDVKQFAKLVSDAAKLLRK